ncbi:MAG TPA: sugar phosphate isomerase/epimerase [Chitinophagaceae bacterium]|nr:sugar phosphate isomerase/epimerase [Chitinophagaceae bacterium]
MNYDRRDFIKLSGGISAGFVFSSAAGFAFSNGCENDFVRIKEFGIQLYTLRADMPKDPAGILKQLAGFGYKEIESYEGPQGMFWGMGYTGFKKYMDDLGMKLIASHCDINKNFEKKVEEAAAIGMKYLICPWLGPQKSIDDYKKHAETFNQKGELCKKNGLRFAYHNHDYSFKLQGGQLPQDILMNETDASLVDFELDIYWLVTAGENPDSWFKKYPNRFRLCHVKDRSKSPVPDNGKNSVDLGTGSINWKKILKTSREYGMQHFIVEQEAYPNGTPLNAVKANAEYMKKLKI